MTTVWTQYTYSMNKMSWHNKAHDRVIEVFYKSASSTARFCLFYFSAELALESCFSIATFQSQSQNLILTFLLNVLYFGIGDGFFNKSPSESFR